MIRANQLTIRMEFDGVSVIRLKYTIDDQFDDFLPIHLPWSVPLSQKDLAILGIVGSILLAQLCLAENLLLDFPCSEELVESALPMLSLLYNVRCYRDQRLLLPLPAIKLLQQRKSFKVGNKASTKNYKQAYLIWSGGKDSTLSLLLLRVNGYNVSTLHATANPDTVNSERNAVEKLSNLFNTPVNFIEMDPQPFATIGAKYSQVFARFPEYNSIPHGRDFLLLTLLATLAHFDGIYEVCSGSEYELYSNIVSYRDTLVYRHDSQSEQGYRSLTEYLRRWYGPDFLAFSPVAPLSEFRSFKILLEQAPEAFRYLMSCFWGEWCGRCLKCFRYSLIQEALGSTPLQFQVPPLVGSPFSQFYLDNWANESLSYWQEIHYCFSVLAQRNDLVLGSEILRKYREDVLPHIADTLDEIYEGYLMKTHEVSLLPRDFNATLLG